MGEVTHQTCHFHVFPQRPSRWGPGNVFIMVGVRIKSYGTASAKCLRIVFPLKVHATLTSILPPEHTPNELFRKNKNQMLQEEGHCLPSGLVSGSWDCSPDQRHRDHWGTSKTSSCPGPDPATQPCPLEARHSMGRSQNCHWSQQHSRGWVALFP